jgi:hypothetical protein
MSAVGDVVPERPGPSEKRQERSVEAITPMLPAGRRPPDEQPVVDAELHSMWHRLVADRSAARSWERRFHRTTAGRLATAEGFAAAVEAISRTLDD